ncbi:hypothetical protein N9291_01380 [bacterium]|nr:hypothetical protein [bacterium]MDB4508051.1 hypothetical protein [Akkermansiaceae bacterium]
MTLAEGQIWKKGEEFYLIAAWERLAIEYQLLDGVEGLEGENQRVTKKEFCKLIKGAEMVKLREPEPEPEPEA